MDDDSLTIINKAILAIDANLLAGRKRIVYMSTERRNPFKRDQALNDATAGQLGEEPRPEPYPEKDPRMEVARKRSCLLYTSDAADE